MKKLLLCFVIFCASNQTYTSSPSKSLQQPTRLDLLNNELKANFGLNPNIGALIISNVPQALIGMGISEVYASYNSNSFLDVACPILTIAAITKAIELYLKNQDDYAKNMLWIAGGIGAVFILGKQQGY